MSHELEKCEWCGVLMPFGRDYRFCSESCTAWNIRYEKLNKQLKELGFLEKPTKEYTPG